MGPYARMCKYGDWAVGLSIPGGGIPHEVRLSILKYASCDYSSAGAFVAFLPLGAP